MNTHNLDRLADKIQNLQLDPHQHSIEVISDVLLELIEEVKRIDCIACRASDTTSAIANGIQPD